MTQKKRILICNDAHFLHSGYGKYAKEVLTRLAKTNKYEIAELACFGEVNDPRCEDVPWTYYANSVNEKHPQHDEYQSSESNKSGSWRFEQVCLDFRADLVLDLRDIWVMSFESTSAYRPFFHHCIMPTIDSDPQQDGWIDIINSADSVLTYSDYGKKILETQSNNNIVVSQVASPGVDLNVFTPASNKKEHRNLMGFMPDANVIGTVMRNGSRKLYPDLFETFKKFIDLCYDNDNKNLAENTYLYAHCSYPDVGWEIPTLLREYELGRKVIFTYVCGRCNSVSCSFFRGPRGLCRECNSMNAILPNTKTGVSEKQLSDIINVFDIYIQYSTNEGLGIPQIEAAACGIPIMTLNYSGMEDIINKCHGINIPIKRMFRDHGTNCLRALPDNDKTAELIMDLVSMPSDMIRMKGNKARKAAEKYYDWDNVAKIWENHIDNIELTGLQGKWDSPMLPLKEYLPPLPQNYTGMNNTDFVNWIITEILQDPKKLNSRFAHKIIKDLNFGSYRNGQSVDSFNKANLYVMAVKMADEQYSCELARTGKMDIDTPDFIEYAHKRDAYLKLL